MDDSLIVSKGSLIEPENNNAFSKSEIETQMQRQEEKFVENADLKAQLQEKVFANAALKNELRKIKGNSVDTKFAKASILGKPSLEPSRNHLVVRQPNAFTSDEPRISRPTRNARKMTQDKTRIPNHRDMASTRAHCTPNACTPKLRNIYRSSPVSKCSGGMSNVSINPGICESRAKVHSPKIRNNNPVEPKNHTNKPGRQNGIGQRFSLNKSSIVHEKPHTPRSCLWWKPTGRIFQRLVLLKLKCRSSRNSNLMNIHQITLESQHFKASVLIVPMMSITSFQPSFFNLMTIEQKLFKPRSLMSNAFLLASLQALFLRVKKVIRL
ncbi:hypothetical protein Tco_1354293 [Tanacetum coccineum]